MKRRTAPANLFFLAAFFSAGGVLSAETVIEEEAGAGLLVETRPEGADIFIDGIERGKSPLEIAEISAGSHLLLIRKGNYERWSKLISFSRNSRMKIRIDLALVKGLLEITFTDALTGRPLNAAAALVLADGLPQSASASGNSLELLLPEGGKIIRARIFGYKEASKSVIIEKNNTVKLEFELESAEQGIDRAFLNRPVFNPKNSGGLGSVTLNFSVRAPGRGRLLVFDSEGALIYEAALGEGGVEEPFSGWIQAARWNGRDKNGNIVTEGLYNIMLEVYALGAEAGGPPAAEARFNVQADYNFNITPLSMRSVVPGLANAGFSETLPKGAFQASAEVLAGLFEGGGNAFSRTPFAAALRFSPFNRFETAVSVNICPGADSGGPLEAAGVYVKKEFFKGKELVPGASAGVYYGWVDGKSESSAGLFAGAGINGDFSWKTGAGFALLLSPSLLWSGGKGFPSEAAPRCSLGGGVLWSRGIISAGLSARVASEFAPRFTAEFLCYPPPSNFVFGFGLSCKIEKNAPCFYGGVTLSIIG